MGERKDTIVGIPLGRKGIRVGELPVEKALVGVKEEKHRGERKGDREGVAEEGLKEGVRTS